MWDFTVYIYSFVDGTLVLTESVGRNFTDYIFRFIDGTYSESWLRDFTDYLARWPDSPELAGVTDEQSFNRALKEVTRVGLGVC